MFTKKNLLPLEFNKETVELFIGKSEGEKLFKKMIISGVSKKINVGISSEFTTLNKDLELIAYGYSILTDGRNIDCSIKFKYVDNKLQDLEGVPNLGHVILTKLIDSNVAGLEIEVFIDSLEWFNQILDSFYSQKTDMGVPVISVRAVMPKEFTIDKEIKGNCVSLKLERFWFDSIGVFNKEALSKNLCLKQDLS